jgi:hypothetical protein
VQPPRGRLGTQIDHPFDPSLHQFASPGGLVSRSGQRLFDDGVVHPSLPKRGPDGALSGQAPPGLVSDHLPGETAILDEADAHEIRQGGVDLFVLEPGLSQPPPDLLTASRANTQKQERSVLGGSPGAGVNPPEAGQSLPLNRPAPRRARSRPLLRG